MIKKINLDTYRFLAALMVVAIHISPLVTISSEIDFYFTRVICRVAVPLFLMITGYFILDKALSNKLALISYIKKILHIYILCILLYIPINIYTGSFNNINIINILKDIFINGTMYHLWYFPGLILGLIITYFLIKKILSKAALIATILYILGLIGDSYYGIFSNITFINNIYNIIFSIFDYTRNGVFYMPIFLYLGYAVKKSIFKIDKPVLYSIIFLILMFLEAYLLHTNNHQKHDSMYIFLIPLMICLFTYLVSNNTSTNKELRNISTYIYIIHPLVLILVRFSAKTLSIENIVINNSLILYVLVVIISILISVIYYRVKKGVVEHDKRVRRVC